ncbi:DUF2238 domain-containing protein [Allokutzneria oryzae]|uniref:DUF2238 domain-containing protein n=1 Tax=Allokutzneria oryzae TaxID=1378989 RepID=A0ABV5ZVP2_9PSEU
MKREPLVLLGVVLLAVAASAINPRAYGTWALEVLPIALAAPLLVATYRRFPLTPLAYRLIALHALILTLGAQYTYAEVPLGFWMEDWFGFDRNHYDRIGHFAQGLVPAIVVRELLLRRTPLVPGRWLVTIITFVCLGISGGFEMFEGFVGMLGGGNAADYLGTQGDQWDTQWDMTMALIGASVAQLLFSRVHDRQLASVAQPAGAGGERG